MTVTFIALIVLYWLLSRLALWLGHLVYGRNWYRGHYLNGPYWRFMRRVIRASRLRLCQRWGRHEGVLDVHHRKWAYRWLFWEWLPNVQLFGLEVLCRKHHKMEHD